MDPTTLYMAMKIYVGPSRVETAHDMLLTNELSPTLFSSGPFTWPTRIMQHLRGLGEELKAAEHLEINRLYGKVFLLRDKSVVL